MHPLGRFLRHTITAAVAGTIALAPTDAALAQTTIQSTENTRARPTPSAPAQPDRQRPDAAQRVLRLFDFEELDTNPAPVPRYWYRGQEDRAAGRVRDGFPNWNQAELDYETAFRGTGSLRLPTRGGSTSLILERGVLPIFPTADYLVSSKIMTRGLKHAGAAIIARLLDRTGKVIPGTEQRSTLIRSENAWRDATLQIIGGRQDAGFLELELVLLQAAQHDPARARAAAGDRVDLNGSAWFDDVRVAQMPRIELAMKQPSGIVVAPQTPELTFVIRDLTGEKLDMTMQVRDDAGRIAAMSSQSMRSGARELSLRPDLKKFGWYRARVDVSANSVWVGATELDFVWLPPARSALAPDSASPQAASIIGSADRRRFAVVTDTLPASHHDDLAALIVHSGAGAATLPVWSPDLTADEMPELLKSLGGMISLLNAGDVEMTLSLPVIPESVRRGRTTGMWTVFETPEPEWMPVLEPVLDRFGQSARRWQIGRIDAADAPALGAQLPRKVDRIGEILGRLVPGPIVTSPFASHDAPVPLDTARTLQAAIANVTADVPASSMGALAESWRTSGADAVTFVLPRLDDADYGPRAVVSDTARRVIELWARWSSDTASAQDSAADNPANSTPARRRSASRPAPNIVAALREPWRISDGLRPRLMPRPEIAAWRTLTERLADRRVVGELSIGQKSLPGGPGRIRCLILAPSDTAPQDRGGALVAWNQSAEPEDAVIRAPLGGSGIRVVDIFGNESPARTEQPPVVREGDAPPAPLTVVPLTDMPVFIEGIDLNLVLFLASFRIEPDLLLSTNQTHEHDLVFANPWEEGLNGRLWIIRPNVTPSPIEGVERVWKISPRSSRIAVAPMAEGRVPVRIAFDPAEEAGPKEFEVEFELTAGRQYGRVRVTSVMELGLKDLKLDVTCRLGPNATGPDVLVEVVITNVGTREIDADVSAFAPDLPRERARISGLAPGNQTVRRFVFPAAAANLRGQQIIVSLAEANSGARLNRSTNVP